METLKITTIKAVRELPFGDIFLDGINGDYTSDTEEKMRDKILEIIIAEKYE